MDSVFLPAFDRGYLQSKGYKFREINDGAKNGLIIENFPVTPEGKFNTAVAQLLILIPRGYPDVAPDMFYFHPAVQFAGSNANPAQADVNENHFGTNWQRWSRHSTPEAWRPGIDGVNSYVQRVLTALKTA